MAILAAIAVGSISLDRVRELPAIGREQMKDAKLKRRQTQAQVLKIRAYEMAARQLEKIRRARSARSPIED